LYESPDQQALRRSFHQFSQLSALVLLPVTAILLVFGREILTLWLRDAATVENVSVVFSLLVIGNALNAIVAVPAVASQAFGVPQLLTMVNVGQFVLMAPLLIVLVRGMQGAGAALSWAILNSTYLLVYAPLFFRSFLKEERRCWFLVDIGMPALVAAGVSLLLAALQPSTLSMALQFAWIVGSGVITFAATGISLPAVRMKALAIAQRD
jgi:O-antigen/teichoic acid export membrane protein